MRKRPPVGSILRVSVCWAYPDGNRYTGNINELSDTPAWAFVNKHPVEAQYIEVFWLDDRAEEEDWTNGICLVYDRFRVVPEHKVPDEVWADLMRRRLLGEQV